MNPASPVRTATMALAIAAGLAVSPTALSAPPLPPGRHVATDTDGRTVWLDVTSDEGLLLGGLPVVAEPVDGGFTLRPRRRPAEPARYSLQRDATGGWTLGGVFAAPRPLRAVPFTHPTPPAPAPDAQLPPDRPAIWVGRWTHRAVGGWLTLVFHADGRCELLHGDDIDPPRRTLGRWGADATSISLRTGDGPALRYTARLEHLTGRPARLWLGGGDLPTEVALEADPEAGDASDPPDRLRGDPVTGTERE